MRLSHDEVVLLQKLLRLTKDPPYLRLQRRVSEYLQGEVWVILSCGEVDIEAGYFRSKAEALEHCGSCVFLQPLKLER